MTAETKKAVAIYGQITGQDFNIQLAYGRVTLPWESLQVKNYRQLEITTSFMPGNKSVVPTDYGEKSPYTYFISLNIILRFYRTLKDNVP